MGKVLCLFCSVVFLFSNSVYAENLAKELIRSIDNLYRLDTSYAVIQMTITNPNWSRPRVIKLKAWSKGKKHTLIRIMEPLREKGITTLRVDKDMWNYFPKIDRVMKISPSMMMSSWLGSDFTNDDLVKSIYRIDSKIPGKLTRYAYIF